MFVIQAPDQVRGHWQRVTEMLRKQFPTAVPVMEAARDDVLAFLNFPQEHWRKVWSTNPLERLNKEIKRRTNVVGIFPNDAAIVRLVGAQLLEQQEEWQLERRRFVARPRWPRSRSRKSRWSSLLLSRPPSRQQAPAEPQHLLPRSTQNTSIAELPIQRSGLIVDERSCTISFQAAIS